MRVSVYFYGSIDEESVVWRSLRKLYTAYEDYYYIGGAGGFGVKNLSWSEATKLTALIAATIYKADCESVLKEFRILMQEDVADSATMASINENRRGFED